MKGRTSKKAKLLNKWNSYLFLILIQASVPKKHSKMFFCVCVIIYPIEKEVRWLICSL